MTECRTVTVSIQRPADEVYNYLVDPEKFPQWSTFVTKIERDGSAWRATTPCGTIRIQFEPRNVYRVLDHTVTTAEGKRVHVPMRVVHHGSGASAVIFTVFRQPDMTDEHFAADVALVETDLASLKRVLEA